MQWNCFESMENAEGVATIKCLEPLVANIVTAIISVSGIALFIMLVSGGFTFLFSSGDPKKLEKAKGTLTASLVGLVVIVSALLIIKAIQQFTGVNLTTFEIKTQ